MSAQHTPYLAYALLVPFACYVIRFPLYTRYTFELMLCACSYIFFSAIRLRFERNTDLSKPNQRCGRLCMISFPIALRYAHYLNQNFHCNLCVYIFVMSSISTVHSPPFFFGNSDGIEILFLSSFFLSSLSVWCVIFVVFFLWMLCRTSFEKHCMCRRIERKLLKRCLNLLILLDFLAHN